MLEEMFPTLAEIEILNNSALAWIVALGIAFLVYTAAYSGLRFIGRAMSNRARKHGKGEGIATVLGGVFCATRGTLIFVLTFAVALRSLTFSAGVLKILKILAFGAAGIQVALWLSTLVSIVVHRAYNHEGKPQANTVILDLLIRAGQLIIWSIVLIVVLDNAGVNVTTFIASLGIGGIAVAFALQKILGDLFASIAIGLDKPFEAGHFISFDGNSGTVEQVGIKTSHVRTPQGEVLVVSNSKLTDSVIKNVTMMRKREVTFNLKVAYGTESAKVRKILAGIREAIENTDQVWFTSVNLIAFADSGLQFEIVYAVAEPKFALYRQVHEVISLKIMDLLEQLDVDFAVPTRKVRVTKGGQHDQVPATF